MNKLAILSICYVLGFLFSYIIFTIAFSKERKKDIYIKEEAKETWLFALVWPIPLLFVIVWELKQIYIYNKERKNK